MSELKVEVVCECNHIRGPLYYALPWLWGRPCRRCRRRGPTTQVIVVSPQGAQPMQQQQPWQQQQQEYMPNSAMENPPSYNSVIPMKVAVN